MEKKLKILVIEDTVSFSQMYVSKLESCGFEALVCQDGEEGFLVGYKEKPDLILLDIILPKLDGFAVLRLLKENPQTKNIPVILLTCLSQKSDIEKGLKLGAEDYLIKDQFSPQEIVDKIKKILSLS